MKTTLRKFRMPARLKGHTPEFDIVHVAPFRNEDVELFDDGHPFRDAAPILVIDSVKVPTQQRGKGIGTRAMKAVVKEADRTATWLFLTCHPWEVIENGPDEEEEDMARNRLVRWYSKFGFKPAYEGSHHMWREPKQS